MNLKEKLELQRKKQKKEQLLTTLIAIFMIVTTVLLIIFSNNLGEKAYKGCISKGYSDSYCMKKI